VTPATAVASTRAINHCPHSHRRRPLLPQQLRAHCTSPSSLGRTLLDFSDALPVVPYCALPSTYAPAPKVTSAPPTLPVTHSRRLQEDTEACATHLATARATQSRALISLIVRVTSCAAALARSQLPNTCCHPPARAQAALDCQLSLADEPIDLARQIKHSKLAIRHSCILSPWTLNAPISR
jgi:hypothetical protein